MTVDDTGTDKLLIHVDDGIATITFNNPEKHNALSVEMRAALPRLLESLQQDPDVRIVVLTGAGTKAFVSGADISEFGRRRTSPEARAEFDRASADGARAWAALAKPVIAMIRGYCIGGGLLTALAADIRIASADSEFGVPAARLGLGYGMGGVEALYELVGPAWSARLTVALSISTSTSTRSPGWSRRASARRTTWRASEPSPRNARPGSSGAEEAVGRQSAARSSWPTWSVCSP